MLNGEFMDNNLHIPAPSFAHQLTDILFFIIILRIYIHSTEKNGRIIRPFLQCKDTFFNKSFHLFEYFLFVIFNLAFLQHLFVFIHHVLLFVMFRLVFDISNNGGYLIF